MNPHNSSELANAHEELREAYRAQSDSLTGSMDAFEAANNPYAGNLHSPDDVKQLAVAVLSHRLIVKSQASLREVDPEQIVREILASVPVAEAAAAAETGRSRIS